MNEAIDSVLKKIEVKAKRIKALKEKTMQLQQLPVQLSKPAEARKSVDINRLTRTTVNMQMQS